MLRTRIVWTGVAGAPYYSTFHWNGDSPAIAEEAQDQTVAFLSGAVGLIHPLLRGTVEPQILGINAATGVLFDVFDGVGSTSVGVNAAEPLPYQVQARTVFSTEDILRGRRVRGRTYLPGLCETAQSTGVGPIEAFREVIQSLYTADLQGGTAQLVVWSRPQNEAMDNGQTSLVSGTTTSPVWSSLRTRRAS